jgi:hypothetical protein
MLRVLSASLIHLVVTQGSTARRKSRIHTFKDAIAFFPASAFLLKPA